MYLEVSHGLTVLTHLDGSHPVSGNVAAPVSNLYRRALFPPASHTMPNTLAPTLSHRMTTWRNWPKSSSPFRVPELNQNSRLLHWYGKQGRKYSSLVIPMDAAEMVKWTHIMEIMEGVDCTEDEVICAIAHYPCITDVLGRMRTIPGLR